MIRHTILLALLVTCLPIACAQANTLQVTIPPPAVAGAPWSVYVEVLDYDAANETGTARLSLYSNGYGIGVADSQLAADGRAYFVVTSAADIHQIDWNLTVTFATSASTSPGTAPAAEPVSAHGTLVFQHTLDELAMNQSAIRTDVANLSFHGVQLNELGTTNLLSEIGRVTVYASIAVAGVVLVLVAATRLV